MADWFFEKAQTWEDLLAAHEKWHRNYNFQKHLAHEKREDGCHSPATVPGWANSIQPEPDLVYRTFEMIYETRTLTQADYVRFCNFLLYGEQGLAGKKILINIFQDMLTLEYGDSPLSCYSVEWQPNKKHLLRVGNPACMTTLTKALNCRCGNQVKWNGLSFFGVTRLQDHASKKGKFLCFSFLCPLKR